MRGSFAAGLFVLLTWIARPLHAAPEPANVDVPERKAKPEDREHWAYQEIARPVPPKVGDTRWARHPVDRFVKSKLEGQRIEPLPRAGRATLFRRVALDLTGLPPTPARMASFLADDSPDAYEKLVDELLMSTAYGERWAQHWLDLARFAETDGFEHDLVRPHAWRYRDWVIDALNQDLPFDEFLRLQIAGDEIRPNDPQAVLATGFLLCGPDMPDLNLQQERRHLVLNEMTSSVGAVFLGLQFGCAQCHDHKYDAISIHDFYRFRAFFESVDVFHDHPAATPSQWAARQAAESALGPVYAERKTRLRELEDLGKSRFREKNPDAFPSRRQMVDQLPKREQKEHASLVKALSSTPKLPELPMARVVRPGPPRAGCVFHRGDFRRPGPFVKYDVPRVLADLKGNPGLPTEQPRTALAHWMTCSDQPLTARVVVNRLWQWHFGVGLVASSSDFGVMGDAPTHPELLDWLARRFVDDGWSLKRMHKLLMTSEAYQTACGPFDAAWTKGQSHAAKEVFDRGARLDPDDRFLWRRRRTRLDGEAIRDSMLTAAEQLSSRRGGPGVRPPLPVEVTASLLKDQWNVSGDEQDHRRRSIYLFARRNLRYPLFDVFDRPDANASCPQRHESTTATQSLVLLNSQFSRQCARDLAGLLVASNADSTDSRINNAYLRVLSRPASTDELHSASEFLDRQSSHLRQENRDPSSLGLPKSQKDPTDPHALAALIDFCLALFNSSEFVYVD